MEMQKESQVIKIGSNEFKLIEFHVGGMKQGINLIKVKKIIAYRPEDITKVFKSSFGVLGILEVGSDIIQIIDLHQVYGLAKEEKSDKDQPKVIIITEFNQLRYGFVFDDVVKVHRISWRNLQPVDSTCPVEMVVAVATLEDVDIQMIDFEMIIEKVFPKSTPLPPENKTSPDAVIERRKHSKIICCDDSNIIQKKLEYIFKKHQFTDVTICANGQEAFDRLVSDSKKSENKKFFTFMVTDIEMPQMDGLTLCKKTKEMFPKIPVLVLSSLVTDQLKKKCDEVNADAALSKNDISSLVDEMDRLLALQYPTV